MPLCSYNDSSSGIFGFRGSLCHPYRLFSATFVLRGSLCHPYRLFHKMARPKCACSCGCRRKPGRRIECRWCWLKVGPCCIDQYNNDSCHMCWLPYREQDANDLPHADVGMKMEIRTRRPEDRAICHAKVLDVGDDVNWAVFPIS